MKGQATCAPVKGDTFVRGFIFTREDSSKKGGNASERRGAYCLATPLGKEPMQGMEGTPASFCHQEKKIPL